MTNWTTPGSTIRTLLIVLLGSGLQFGCGANNERADAYGNFEATETTISSEATGQLLQFDIDEGLRLEAGARVGLIDTLQLSLKRRQLQAGYQSVRTKTASVRAQLAVVDEQRQVALKEKDRINRLLQDSAATQKQLDDVDGQISVLLAQEKQIRTQNATILAELESIDAQLAQIDDQIRRSTIVNPVVGIVLAKYAERYEMTMAGRPLYKIADLSELILRAYISGEQLPHVSIGETVEVQIDEDATTNKKLTGTVEWISSEAEFTPKLIQTKEERVNLVYAIKVRVRNSDGALKIGMPGEVWLAPTGQAGSE